MITPGLRYAKSYQWNGNYFSFWMRDSVCGRTRRRADTLGCRHAGDERKRGAANATTAEQWKYGFFRRTFNYQ